MATVKNFNGTPDGQSDTMVKYSFSGSPTTLYEHVPEPGERRTMTIVVECTLSGTDIVKDGERAIARFKVVDAELGKPVVKPASDDPELPYESGANAAYGDYGVGQPEGEGPDDEVGEDGYTNAERAAQNSDTPTDTGESAKIVRPSFSGAN
ncbi:hypothetical protein CH276_22580 [Rhodococcus sp. 06-470-2]|uniref:DUF7171 family protein n=1 Tax=unclassified Rhodococcus (in: high G+C Gram-positive bacteria) TaxID=192944 RepID=UPI000B9A51B6|nr:MULTISPECIES: hypothetical protein [unclassified Rhodococcus (in: high G+C Gram-positive bacteria)]OZC59237.1 hypothetical protein CH276_22580 [Rhodococcus sp. 06-470-2]OZE66824.1 hypothetical protein CH265_07905 [Rhodococcus sp. 05-2221-1B]